MDLLRKLNKRMGAAVGYEVRRVRRSGAPKKAASPPAAAKAEQATGRAKSPQVAFRPPENPAVDRLLKGPVFIVCPVRSGSTLLRLLLNAHPQLHAPHELHVRRLEVRCSTRLAERSMDVLGLERGDLEHLLWDRVMHRELVKSGKDVLVEKTPSNAFAYQRIAACWPDARFIFLLRHPASIARSWHEADPAKRNTEEAALDALRYMRATERARQVLSGHTVRYEDLTADPEGVLKGICGFLGIDFERGMLEYGAGTEGDLQKGLGDWKEKIRSGRVQAGRGLPEPDEIPEPLREISTAWGYLEDPASERESEAAHAEIDQVWSQDGRVRITGSLHGQLTAPADAPWRLQLLLREHKDQRLSYPVQVADGRFEASFPVVDLDLEEAPANCHWDIYLAAETRGGEARLRAGRHLDDLQDKKKVLVFPAQRVAGSENALLVKPYYTVKDNLSVACQADEREAAAEAQHGDTRTTS
ncbi:sulfotransferase family protein [Streptomyces umbrinus]|uniref:sulfotransferase family protein n=1 Tax=Streptomyces umbrinus TaxID=67370 RepID=UPI003C2E1BD0